MLEAAYLLLLGKQRGVRVNEKEDFTLQWIESVTETLFLHAAMFPETETTQIQSLLDRIEQFVDK